MRTGTSTAGIDRLCDKVTLLEVPTNNNGADDVNYTRAMTVMAVSVVLTACASVMNAGLAVNNAPQVRDAIASCVADDPAAQVALTEPAEFFTRGYNAIVGEDQRTPLSDLAKQSPGYVLQIEPQWSQIWVALDGKDCGNVVTQWRATSELAWEGFNNLSEGSVKFKRFCDFYALASPMAGFLKPELLLLAPASFPGCQAQPV